MLKNKFYAKFLILIGAALILSACASTDNNAVDDTSSVDTSSADDNMTAAPVESVDVGPAPDSQEALDAIMGGSTVYFAYDRYDVDTSARTTLQAQASWMKSNNKNIIIEGHCDERGTREYNLALGDRRANAVKNYLVAMGVNASRIRTVSYGKERPVDMSDHAKNRRGYSRVN